VNRIAHALAVPPAALVRNEADPLHKPSTGYLLDFDPPEHVLLSLAEGTGQPVDAVRRLTARGYVPSLLDTLEVTQHGVAQYTHALALLLPLDCRWDRHPYVLPWYSLRRFRQTHGCRDCLAEGAEFYLRLHWRFAWMVTCPMHQRMLQPFVIYRHAKRAAQVAWGYKETHMPVPLSHLSMLDTITLQAITHGSCDLPFGTISATLWIRLLRTVLDELGVGLGNAGACRGKLEELWKSVGRAYGYYLQEWRPYERLYPKYQQMFMAMAAKAFADAFEQPAMQHRIMDMARSCQKRLGCHSA